MSLVIGGPAPISHRDVARVADHAEPVRLADAARARLERARTLVEHWSRQDRPAYGLTRGLGGRATTEIAAADRAEYSAIVVRARATGAGGWFDRRTVRAALFARLAGLAQGGAGVRPVILDTQIAMLAAGVHPLVPRIGSVGASDLALCANLALPLMGEGRAEYLGEILPGAEAMRRAGIVPVALLEKEGLALCSNNAISTGLGALLLTGTESLLALTEATLALSFEAFRGNPSPFDPRVVAARPAPGQAESADALRRLLQGSTLFEPDAPRRIQDPISLRCATQVHGALRAGIALVRPNLEAELNGAADNPLVLPDDGEILSTGNFHTPAMAIAFDSLRLALCQTGSMAAQRVGRLMNPGLTGLPERLSRHGPTRAGLGLLGLTAGTLAREMRYLANPVSNDDTGGFDVEDHAPMTPVAVRRTEEQLDLLRQILACELIAAAQAFEMRALPSAAPVATRLFEAIRATVPAFDDDRSTTEEIERVSHLIRTGGLAV